MFYLFTHQNNSIDLHIIGPNDLLNYSLIERLLSGLHSLIHLLSICKSTNWTAISNKFIKMLPLKCNSIEYSKMFLQNNDVQVI